MDIQAVCRAEYLRDKIVTKTQRHEEMFFSFFCVLYNITPAIKYVAKYVLFATLVCPLSSLTRHLRCAALRFASCPPMGARHCSCSSYIPAPSGGRMSEGQEGGLPQSRNNASYLVAGIIVMKFYWFFHYTFTFQTAHRQN